MISLIPMGHVRVSFNSPNDVFLFSKHFVDFQFNSIALI